MSKKGCRRGEDQKKHRIAANTAQIATGAEFWAHDQILEKVDKLIHLGCILYFDESDRKSIIRNLQRAL